MWRAVGVAGPVIFILQALLLYMNHIEAKASMTKAIL